METNDGIAERRKGPANLTVAPFVHGNLPVEALGVAQAHESKFTDSIFECDTKVIDHLLMEGLKLAVEMDFVELGFDELRVGHLVGEIAVVG